MQGKLVLVGFGLLASSIAAALRLGKHAVHIVAVSSPDTQKRAFELGLADAAYGYDQLQQAVVDADLVLLCSPISHILTSLQALERTHVATSKTILVSDIGSTKAAICAQGASLPKPFLFVGGHPMAGSEKRSLEHHDASMYENAYWIVCPPAGVGQDQYSFLLDLIHLVGANTVQLEPAEHDRVMARLSHVPQMVSTALASGLSPQVLAKNHQHLAGRGFRDMTRIAASPWPMWRDIAHTNRDEIRAGLDEMLASLQGIRDLVSELPGANLGLQHVFERGNEVRASLSLPGKGFAHTLHEVMVQLPDQPGTILKVVQPISAAGINILDIELAKVREGIGGQLLLGFKTTASATQAVALLEQAGFQARLRG